MGPLLRVLQGFNQGIGQSWILIWKLRAGAHVVVDSIRFLVVVGLRASDFGSGSFFCLFLVIIASWIALGS